MEAGRLLLLLASLAAAAKPLPEPPRDWVHNESVVSAESERRLSAALSAFERDTGHQFVAALFRSLEGESLEDYSNRLFRHWRIGDAKRNDGVLLALFLDDRRWRVEVGYGLEATLTDLEAGALMDRYAVPRFRGGDLDGGVEAAVSAVIATLSGRTPAPPEVNDYHYGPDELKAFLLLLAFITVLFVGQLVLYRFLGIPTRRSRGWSSGGWGGGGGGWGGGGGGGFSGGGGSSGGGGASGGW